MTAKNFLFCLMLITPRLMANEYEYHPSLAFSLGAGYDASDVGKRFLDCIDFTDSLQIDAQGSYASGVHAKLVQTRSELMQEIGISARISAQGAFGRFKSGVETFDQIAFHEDSLTFLISAKENYGRVKMKDPRLKDFAQKLVDSGEYDEFATRCGTSYVTEVLKGASVFVIYSVHNLSREHKSKIDTMMSGSGSFGFASVSFEATFRKLVEQFASSGRIEVHSYTIGGAGVSSLSEIPNKITDIDALKNIVSAYMKTMCVTSGVPLIFYTASMENFGWHELSPFDVHFRDSVLESYYILATDLNHSIKRLLSILDQQHTFYSFLTELEIQDYQSLYNERVNYFKTVKEEATACFRETSQCKMQPFQPLRRIVWPQAPDE